MCILGIVIPVLCSPLAICHLLTSVTNNPMDTAGPDNEHWFFKPDVPHPKPKLTLLLNRPQEWEPVLELGVSYQPLLVLNLLASWTLQHCLERTLCVAILKHNTWPQTNASCEQFQLIRWQNTENRAVTLLWQIQPYTQVNMSKNASSQTFLFDVSWSSEADSKTWVIWETIREF